MYRCVVRSNEMGDNQVTYVQKACAYVTRGDPDGDRELLVFDGPGHDSLQIPKGTVESDETPREAVVREVAEESGLVFLGGVSHLVTDVWTRRPSRRYVRHFFHACVDEPRDRWTHVVTGDGEERGCEFDCFWVDLPTDRDFALSLDEYVHRLDPPDRRRITNE